MRKILVAISAAGAFAFTTAASAQVARYPTNYVAPVAGAAVGTAVGVGLYNGWYGGSFAASLPSTAAGAAVAGGVAGVGTAALIHAAATPCTGFQALFANLLTRPEGCVNGQYVGYSGGPGRYR